jgi:hypothetical protein
LHLFIQCDFVRQQQVQIRQLLAHSFVSSASHTNSATNHSTLYILYRRLLEPPDLLGTPAPPVRRNGVGRGTSSSLLLLS